MFRIRRIYDFNNEVNKLAIEQTKIIFYQQFPDVKSNKFDEIYEQLLNPLKFRYRTLLYVAENAIGKIKGFSILLHFSDINFYYLDYIAASKSSTSRGIGGALYEKIRLDISDENSIGLFFECLPDIPELSKNEQIRKQNAARLKFYERYAARPIINTKYETPVKDGDDNPPFLVFDDINKNNFLESDKLKEIVKAILERKYPDYCPQEYIETVLNSINENPIKLREFKYIKKQNDETVNHNIKNKIYLVINEEHSIHHIKERGYVESPVRIKSILKELDKAGLFIKSNVKEYPESIIKEVHNHNMFNYIKNLCTKLNSEKSVYPYVFPIRNKNILPVEKEVLAGYYCIDTFTPLHKNAFKAAKRAVDCTLTAADFIISEEKIAYSLVRPPGHHAESNVFGGFCYFNSASIAANYMSKIGKVALLDIDYHHGNGHQDIFYKRNDVLTISIHGNPKFAYPYFTGFKAENGESDGLGYNINYPLEENIDGKEYRKVLVRAIEEIKKFKPKYLIIAVGFDTAKGDPTGTWSLTAEDFNLNGHLLGELKIPTLVVQEGGYKNRTLGINARNFFSGFHYGFFKYNL